MLPASILIRKLRRLSWCDRLLLLEATFWLAVAALAIAVLPFNYLGRLAVMPTCRLLPSDRTRLIATHRIRWALVACANQLPCHAMCFQQGLAAQIMLRLRGIPSMLYYGAAPDDQRGLSAHVWVRDRDVDVIGGEISSRYAVLTTFPPQGEKPGRKR